MNFKHRPDLSPGTAVASILVLITLIEPALPAFAAERSSCLVRARDHEAPAGPWTLGLATTSETALARSQLDDTTSVAPEDSANLPIALVATPAAKHGNGALPWIGMTIGLVCGGLIGTSAAKAQGGGLDTLGSSIGSMAALTLLGGLFGFAIGSAIAGGSPGSSPAVSSAVADSSHAR